MKKGTALKLAFAGAFLLQAMVARTLVNNGGLSELSDGRGGTNVEAAIYTEQMGFNKERSLKAFQDTLYPVLRANCSGCHSTENKTGSGAQAPLHSDVDVKLAHEYALTRVNFREPANSKFVVRMDIDRHNCFDKSCAAAAEKMLAAVSAWRDAVKDMIPEVPRGVDAATRISEDQVLEWIRADQAKTPAADREFIKYSSLHALHNAGVSALNMNHARVGLSKALNTAARWAPKIVNPKDVNGKGIVYRFDLRDYWGHSLIDTSDPDFALFAGSSDDDLAFAPKKVDRNGKVVKYADLAGQIHKLKPAISRDDKFARLVWERVLRGNVEAATDDESYPPNIDGFVGKRDTAGNGREYVKPENLLYVEATQLAYTLSRPDVYNAVMAIPGYSYKFEEELGVDKSKGMDSYNYMVTYEAITVDSRFMWRAQTKNGGYYWKTFDVFTQGEGDAKNWHVDQAYKNGNVTYPFWQHPIPKFITNQGGTTPADLSYVATLPLGGFSFSTNGTVGKWTGAEGAQQSAEELIYSLPNGLQGYAIFGAWNQRRVDAFTNIVRDPRVTKDAPDELLNKMAGFGRTGGIDDLRLNSASSCMGCHIDGMNRANNDIRDWLDAGGNRLPKASGGPAPDAWVNQPETVARVRELYKPTSVMRGKMEDDRRVFLTAMAQIKQEMVLGADKNTYVEPIIWSAEWAQRHYKYPVTRSN